MKAKQFLSAILAFVLLFCTAAVAEAPATWTGVAQGFGGPVTVTLTLTDGAITEAVVVGDSETPTIGGAALPQLAEQLVAANSAEIDGVAGATLTSNAAREAAQKALNASNGIVAEAAALTDGVYTATRESFQGEHVTMSVTIAEGRIADVTIDEITDYPSTITDVPCAQIPGDIVAHQTYNVDGVTGATFTSNAIRGAVRDCLEQAGGADAFSTPVAKPEIVVGEDAETDVLVVGGGAAGMTAALEACYGDELGTPSGAKVMLIEKAGFLGGTSGVSGGSFTTYRDETNAYDEAWIQSCVDTNLALIANDMQEPFNSELHRTWMRSMKRSHDLLAYLNIPTELNGYLCKIIPPENGKERWAGSHLVKYVNNLIGNTPIDLRLNTAATDLLVNDKGEVIGVSVQDKTSTYNIYAKKVILACGGFANNRELLAKYAPDYTNAYLFCSGTTTGDGLRMATELGAGVVGSEMLSQIAFDEHGARTPDWSSFYLWRSPKYMLVNTDGMRFCNEHKTCYEIASEIAHTKDLLAWAIVDAEAAAATNVGTEHDIENGFCYTADTLEELAEKIGVPAETLVATTKTYNAAAAGEIEDEFGGTVDTMNSIDDGPYFALKMRTCMLSTLVAVTVDENCHVLTEQGEMIPNLFATGDMVLGNILKTYNGGHGVGNAIYTGTAAAQTAKTEIQNEQ